MLQPNDTYRVLRALEVALAGQASARPEPLRSLVSDDIAFAKVFLDVDDRALQTRIELRADAMIAGGLLEEAERIGSGALAAGAVGYPQAIAFLQGWCTRAELRALMIRATRRYAKRQATWFRSEPDIAWANRTQSSRRQREILGWV